jgi:hypothetical protein
VRIAGPPDTNLKKERMEEKRKRRKEQKVLEARQLDC